LKWQATFNEWETPFFYKRRICMNGKRTFYFMAIALMTLLLWAYFRLDLAGILNITHLKERQTALID
jgi:hypothetical protein